MKNNNQTLSPLNHTWIFDLDGTIFKHNGYLQGKMDILLPGVADFWNTLPKDDLVVILTSRTEKYRKQTESALHDYHLRYDYIVFDVPTGERILVNDNKPSGLEMAKSIAVQRDEGLLFRIEIDNTL